MSYISWERLIYLVDEELYIVFIKKVTLELGMVAHACNPRYLGG
jgi:hypothetical protein